MSNLDTQPPVVERGGREEIGAHPVRNLIPGRRASIGPGTDVRRLLPTLGRRLVGAWCFLDHYGPDDVSTGPGMQVAPHPHAGLQTVSWLFEGEVHHRDSLGSDQTFGPGQLGLMTAGHGIAHSEQSPVPHPNALNGTQLWVALPDHARDRAPTWDFQADVRELDVDGARVRLMLGEFGGERSPATAFSPIVGLDLQVPGATTVQLPIEPDFEYAAICVDADASAPPAGRQGVAEVDGGAEVDGVGVPVGSLLYLGVGRRTITVTGRAGGGNSHLMLLGGEPFEEHLVMWWNFVGRSHEEVESFRTAWQDRSSGSEPARFGEVSGWNGTRLDAPPMPGVRLEPRNRGR